MADGSPLKKILSKYGYYQKQDLTRQSYISEGATTEWLPDDYDIYGRKRVPLKDLEWYYSHAPLVWNGINMKAASIWGKGMYVVSDDPDARRLAKQILTLPNFRRYIIKGITGGFVYGFQPLELIWDKYDEVPDSEDKIISKDAKEIIGIVDTDPKLFRPKLNEYGELQAWYQRLPRTTTSGLKIGVPGQGVPSVRTNDTSISSLFRTKEFHPDQIANFKFWTVADQFQGIGLVEPLVRPIHTIMSARVSMGDLIFRYGVPFTHVKITGGEKDELRKIGEFMKHISSKKSIATTERYDFSFPGVGRRVPDLSFALDFLTDTLAGGLRVPKPLLMQAGEKANKAVLEQLANWNMEDTINQQESVSDIIENQIFKPLMKRNDIKDIPSVRWFPSSEEREEVVIKNQTAYMVMLKEALVADFITPETAKRLFEQKLNIIDGEVSPTLKRLTRREDVVTGPWARD